MTEPKPSLYERIGGADGIVRAVSKFYNLVLADPELAPFFQHTPVDRLLNMQQEFFSSALDGPIRYTGRSLVEAHHGRGIEMGHFSRFVQHLLTTLKDFHLTDHEIDEIIARISTQANKVTEDANVDG
ncbi:MAG: group 1 truncated hemoglobin [Planctomycetaceae bacterium]|nr:group 1 truncated hemoglobin [Planctomycetaceae bacterium]